MTTSRLGSWTRLLRQNRPATAAIVLGALVVFALATGAGARPASQQGIDSCKDGGWRTQGFPNQGKCVRYYATSSSTSTSFSTSTSSSTSTSTSSSTSTTVQQVTTPNLFVGFADTVHDPSQLFVPSPWVGDAGVVFLGCVLNTTECGQVYEAGAIRVDNPTDNPALTLSAASVVIGPCTFTPWGTLVPAAVQPGGSLVLTQTGLLGPPQPTPCDGRMAVVDRPLLNFETSRGPLDTADPPFSNCDPALIPAPVITLTFSNGMTLTATDSAEVLNTGGVDRFACTGAAEGTPWTAVAAGDIVRSG